MWSVGKLRHDCTFLHGHLSVKYIYKFFNNKQVNSTCNYKLHTHINNSYWYFIFYRCTKCIVDHLLIHTIKDIILIIHFTTPRHPCSPHLLKKAPQLVFFQKDILLISMAGDVQTLVSDQTEVVEQILKEKWYFLQYVYMMKKGQYHNMK